MRMMLVLVVIYNNTNNQTGEWQKSIVDTGRIEWTVGEELGPICS
jgi:hypothetical protein